MHFCVCCWLGGVSPAALPGAVGVPCVLSHLPAPGSRLPAPGRFLHVPEEGINSPAPRTRLLLPRHGVSTWGMQSCPRDLPGSQQEENVLIFPTKYLAGLPSGKHAELQMAEAFPQSSCQHDRTSTGKSFLSSRG